MKRFLPLILGVVLIAGLVFVNRNMNKGTEVDEDEAAQQQAQQAQKQQAQQAQKPPPLQSHPFASSLPPDEMLGKPQAAKYKVLFGYTVDEASQANPRLLMNKVNAVRVAVKNRPGVFAVISDVDVPIEDRAPFAQMVTQEGLTVNGVPTDITKLSAVLDH